MASLAEWLNKSLKDMSHVKFKDIVRIDTEVKPMGDGQVVLISDINRANLSLVTSTGEKRYLTVIAKSEPITAVGKALADENEVFNCEIMMYSDVLKTMERLMAEAGDTELMWPECFHCADNKLIFQDLCEMGYRVVPTYEFLDYEHTLLVMENIAKFHGLSMVMDERRLLNKSKLKPCILEKRVPFISNLQKMYAASLAKSMKATWGQEWAPTADKIVALIANPGDSLYDMCQSMKGIWCVLNHGDFSLRNMMFHYPPGSTKPDKIKFVDFQMCHYSNFAIDLASLLYSSLMPQVRDKYMESFLKTYIDSLRRTCESLGYKGQVPTVDDAKSCLRSLSYMTVTNSLMSIPFFMASRKQDVQKAADELMEALGSEEVLDGYHDSQEDIFYSDKEVNEVMKYEVKRMIKENII